MNRNRVFAGALGSLLLIGAAASSAADVPPQESVASRSMIRSETRLADDVARAIEARPGVDLAAVGRKGTVSALRGDLGRVTRNGKELRAAELRPVLERVLPAFRLRADDLQVVRTEIDSDGRAHVRYRQKKNGLEVVGSTLSLHIAQDGLVYAAFGNARDGEDIAPQARHDATRAKAEAVAGRSALRAKAARLVYLIASSDQTMHLAWEVAVEGTDNGQPVAELCFVSATTGRVVDRHGLIHDALDRSVRSAYQWECAGGEERNEGDLDDLEVWDPEYRNFSNWQDFLAKDDITNANFDLLGKTYDYFMDTHERDSYDGNGATLVSNVHQYVTYDSGEDHPIIRKASWSPIYQEMNFSDGYAIRTFEDDYYPGVYYTSPDYGSPGYSPAAASDGVTHEFTHGVTQFSSGLIYACEPGAINEAMSDIFAAAADAHYYTGDPPFPTSIWSIGETTGTPFRKMDDPAWDMVLDQNMYSADYYPDVLPYPANFVPTNPNDLGRVHFNSGIANLAFHLMVKGGMHPRGKTSTNVPRLNSDGERESMDRARKIFYRANNYYLGPGAQFSDLRIATVQAALDLVAIFGEDVSAKISLAWDAVGVPVLNGNRHPVDISTQANVGTGDSIMIAGMILHGGGTAKPMLLRAVGPTLQDHGVSGVLANPKLVLYSGGTPIAQNDDWSGSPDRQSLIATAAAVGAFPLRDPSLDSALLPTLGNGAFTAHLFGADGGTGYARVQVYDPDPGNPNHLANLSTRCRVTSTSPMQATFTIGGEAHKWVLIRAVGPTLGQFGVQGTLPDPRLRVFLGSTQIRENDNWNSDILAGDLQAVQQTTAAIGAFALTAGSKDAALLLQLPPGTYRAEASSVTGAPGICMLEVYEVPDIE